MGCQFVAGYKQATAPKMPQTELPMPGLPEIDRASANRPVPDLAITSETDVFTIKSVSHAHTTVTSSFVNQADAPACPNCGSMTVRNGACYKCLNCGESLGCS